MAILDNKKYKLFVARTMADTTPILWDKNFLPNQKHRKIPQIPKEADQNLAANSLMPKILYERINSQ
ncbi:MAG: hypothetical protein SV062_04140 [Thermodesulfobacteriota bacterium]|nr:hypothetical protein [Thermodesulfobacteriota bacterium]